MMKITLPPNQHKVSRVEQGHPYLLRGQKVIALESGEQPEVLIVNDHKPWRNDTEFVSARELVCMPMKYLSGAVSPIDQANKETHHPDFEPCCDNEQRGWGGGCKTCGAPGF